METFHETTYAAPVASYRTGIEKTNPLAVTCDVFSTARGFAGKVRPS